MNICLRPELKKLVEEDIRRGPYQSVDEFIERAISLPHEQETWFAEHRTEISAKIDEGYSSAQRGELIDSESVRRSLDDSQACLAFRPSQGMTQCEFTPQARDDLFEIWSYIAKDSSESADRVENMILAACEILARSPFLGIVREDLTMLASAFLGGATFPELLHDPTSKPVQVIRILHGARNLPSVFE